MVCDNFVTMRLFFGFYFSYLWRWVRFYRGAKTLFQIHSPLAAELTRLLLHDRRAYYVFSQARILRETLKRQSQSIVSGDLGAESRAMPKANRTIGRIARFTAISERSGKWLFRLVNWRKPQTMLELGTSLGISTLYQAAGAQKANFMSVEGRPELAIRAQQQMVLLGYSNVKIINGLFSETLPHVLSVMQTIDYLFIDGDHRYEPTLQYFETCLPFLHSQSVVVVADIYWSGEMERAWKSLRQHPRVSLSLDLFDLGILFFRTDRPQAEHFSIIPYWFKPWGIGLFS